MIWTPLALMVALIVYMFFGIQVGMARGRYGVKAPAVSGHPEFERYFRVQMNTLEQLMVIVPSSVAFAYFVGDMWAAIAVTVFIVGRLVYFRSYIADPDSRGAGFGLSALPGMVMLIGTIIAIVLRLLG
ncbi:MAG: MAPEG family protein [Pseudomonadales bacterium]|nr:MAPEG family protein [Pseudomonadales bacterium]